jgi:RHS repeat-associated protein
MAIYRSESAASEADLIEFPLYATGRIGEFVAGSPIDDDITAATDDIVNIYSRYGGYKQYEITDYLGNVRAVLSDMKTDSDNDGIYENEVLVSNDYFPFGMLMPGRNENADAYRYGYQGKEHDDEMKSNSNSYDFGARMYDPRVGRWLSLDPLAGKYPSESPFNAMGNDPINKIDPTGMADHEVRGEVFHMAKTLIEDAHISISLLELDGAHVATAAGIASALSIGVLAIEGVGVAMTENPNQGTNIKGAGVGAGIALTGAAALFEAPAVAILAVPITLATVLFGESIEEESWERENRMKAFNNGHRIYMLRAKEIIEAFNVLEKSVRAAYDEKINQVYEAYYFMNELYKSGVIEKSMLEEASDITDTKVAKLKEQRDENIRKLEDAAVKKLEEQKKICLPEDKTSKE